MMFSCTSCEYGPVVAKHGEKMNIEREEQVRSPLSLPLVSAVLSPLQLVTRNPLFSPRATG